MPGLFGLGGHLGASVSALVDGQLDPAAAERAWSHVAGCPDCRVAVEHEGRTKSRLRSVGGSQPSSSLIDALVELRRDGGALAPTETEIAESWAAVAELEHRGRGRRRAGIAAVGVGSVSAAVLGFSALSGAPLGIGGAPGAPSTLHTPPAASPVSAPRGSGAPTRRPLGGVRLAPSGDTLPIFAPSPR